MLSAISRRLSTTTATAALSTVFVLASACGSSQAPIVTADAETQAEPAPPTVTADTETISTGEGAARTAAQAERCEEYWLSYDSEFDQRCAALLECVAHHWGPPDDSELLLSDSGRWGGETPRAALNAAYESGAGSPIVWLDENYGIALSPMRSIAEDDVIGLLRSAAERNATETRRVTSTFTLRMEQPDPDSLWTSEDIAEFNDTWAAAGVVDGYGGWFLDIADLAVPEYAPPRIGVIGGRAIDLSAPPICPGHTPPGGLAITEATPFSEIARDSDGDFVNGRLWREIIGLLLDPDSGLDVLVNASAAETLPSGVDVHQVSLAAYVPPEAPAWAEAWEAMTGALYGDDPVPGAEYLASEPVLLAVTYEIDGDGRLLSVEWDMSDPLQNAMRALQSGSDEELARLLEIPEFAQLLEQLPDVEEVTWRTTWQPDSEARGETSENALSVWRRR